MKNMDQRRCRDLERGLNQDGSTPFTQRTEKGFFGAHGVITDITLNLQIVVSLCKKIKNKKMSIVQKSIPSQQFSFSGKITNL